MSKEVVTAIRFVVDELHTEAKRLRILSADPKNIPASIDSLIVNRLGESLSHIAYKLTDILKDSKT